MVQVMCVRRAAASNLSFYFPKFEMVVHLFIVPLSYTRVKFGFFLTTYSDSF